MTDKLARIRWQMGQALLPDHFVAQEESLTLESLFRFRMRGLPDYGIAELKFNESLLAEGILSIQHMTAVMPSGLLLEVPGNAKVSSFNLNIPGSVTVPVYFHLIRSRPAELEQRQDAEEEVVSRVTHQLVLTSEQSYPDALETFKLVEFEKDPDSIWHLSGRYIPPLLQTGTTPFLDQELSGLSEILENFHYKLTQEIAASHLSGESLTGAKQCLRSVYRIQRFLANLFSKVHLHPYFLYEALKEFYSEVCFYENSVPEHITDPFDPDNLATCFGRILDPLKNEMQVVQAPSPYLPFELRDNIWRIALPPRTREAREVYFLIQKKHVSEVVSTREIKLASVSRIPVVHKLALQGVPLKKIERPPFQHTFGSEVDFYLITEGEEWDHALRDLSLGFYHLPRLEGMRFYLYWRFS